MLVKWITPYLAVCGADWPGETFSMSEVTRAVDWIQMGHNAYVASDEVAREILKELGLSDEQVANKLCFATTPHRVVTDPPLPATDSNVSS